MADAPTFEVMHRWAETLRPLMPTQLESADLVPVWYSNPGDRTASRENVWFDQVTDDYEVHSLRQGRRRRKLRSGFEVIIEVILFGATADSVLESEPLQLRCDRQVSAIRQVIDEHIADDEHLSCADLIDVAWLVSSKTERGLVDQGVANRTTLRVEFDARIL